MYRITKEFHFSASHQLCHLHQNHPCARMHGHNYIVEVELASETLDEDGFVFLTRRAAGLKSFRAVAFL